MIGSCKSYPAFQSFHWPKKLKPQRPIFHFQENPEKPKAFSKSKKSLLERQVSQSHENLLDSLEVPKSPKKMEAASGFVDIYNNISRNTSLKEKSKSQILYNDRGSFGRRTMPANLRPSDAFANFRTGEEKSRKLERSKFAAALLLEV